MTQRIGIRDTSSGKKHKGSSGVAARSGKVDRRYRVITTCKRQPHGCVYEDAKKTRGDERQRKREEAKDLASSLPAD
jgi:hypothetical protein